MTAATMKRLWKNDYFQTVVVVITIIAVVFGSWLGSQLVLGTSYPALAVASGSMCKVEYMGCDGWSHPFERTLHTGDLIIVQGVNAHEVKTGFDPEGDIIVFHRPRASESAVDELIVHRTISNTTRENGLVYFKTRGDGSSGSGGDYWSNDFRGENYSWSGMISEKLLVGKVVLRIPWIGHLALLMHNSSGVYLILIVLVLLVIVEFAIPLFRKTRPSKSQEADTELTSES